METSFYITNFSLKEQATFLILLSVVSVQSTGLGIYKRKKQENKKTRTRPRKHARVHEKKELAQDNTHSIKKASTKKRTRSRKHALDQESK